MACCWSDLLGGIEEPQPPARNTDPRANGNPPTYYGPGSDNDGAREHKWDERSSGDNRKDEEAIQTIVSEVEAPLTEEIGNEQSTG